MNKEAIQLVANINRKTARLQEISEELERSIRIKDMWPEAFECGNVSIGLNKVYAGSGMSHTHRLDLEASKLIMSRSDGEHREYRLIDSPIQLWEETFNEIQPNYKRCMINNKRK